MSSGNSRYSNCDICTVAISEYTYIVCVYVVLLRGDNWSRVYNYVEMWYILVSTAFCMYSLVENKCHCGLMSAKLLVLSTYPLVLADCFSAENKLVSVRTRHIFYINSLCLWKYPQQQSLLTLTTLSVPVWVKWEFEDPSCWCHLKVI